MQVILIRVFLAAAVLVPSSAAVAGPNRAQFDLEGDFSAAAGHESHGSPAAGQDETRLRIDVAERELKALQENLNRLQRVLAQEEAGTEELRTEAAVVADDTVDNAIELYRQGGEPATLVAADVLSKSLRADALGRAAVTADTDVFDRYRSLLKDLELNQRALAVRQQEIDDLESQVAVIEDELTIEQLWLVELEEQRLSQQAAEESVRTSMRAQYQGRRRGFYLTTCPVNGLHEFVDSWGFARSGGRRHKGVDMLADAGTELVAPVNGQVEFATSRLGGRVFRMVDDNGNYYYGAHLSAFGKEGRVLAGEVIGYVGDSGNAAGINHLHFEVHPGGQGSPINPFLDTATVCSGAKS